MLGTVRYVLTDAPIVIDPLSAALELRVAVRGVDERGVVSGDGPPPRWVRLGRVQSAHAAFPFANSSMVHFFGPGDRPEECPYVLVYDASGFLRWRLDRMADGSMEPIRIPEEYSGKVVLKPSVRLSFDSKDDAHSLFHLAEKVRRSDSPDQDDLTALAGLLRRAVGAQIIPTARLAS